MENPTVIPLVGTTGVTPLLGTSCSLDASNESRGGPPVGVDGCPCSHHATTTFPATTGATTTLRTCASPPEHKNYYGIVVHSCATCTV